jgi:streptogramin lyase
VGSIRTFRLRPIFSSVLCGLLTGCVITSPSDAPTSDPGLAIQGTIMGGQQPIVGAHVYLLAAGTGGNAGPGIAASALNASQSLLTSVSGSTTLDQGSGPTGGYYYATSGPGGAFSITGDYSCTPNTQVYLYALGGNAGAGTNSAAGLMTLLGNCPSLGSFQLATPFVFMNEVSTIAAAYSIAGYATDATHVSSSGTGLARTGIANAFANSTNLETLATGFALATTPAGNGTVPQAKINTLANILASCVNSTGPSSTACSTLFTNAKSNGSTGTTATDTVTAGINIAHNPTANLAALFPLPAATPPFQPGLSVQPGDFTVALSFTGGGIDSPFSLAVDGVGNVWMVNANTGSVSEMNGVTGAAMSPAGGFTGNGLTAPFSIAIDAFGNVWVVNAITFTGQAYTLTSVSAFNPSGIALLGSPFTGGGLNIQNNFGTLSPRDIAFDANGNAWIANSSNGSVTELNGLTGSAMSPATTGFPVTSIQTVPSGLAVDSKGIIWVSGFGANTLYTMRIADGLSVGSSANQAGGLAVPYSIAIDAGDNAWLPNYNSQSGTTVSKFTSVTTGTAFSGGGTLAPDGVAIDGAGNVWISNQNLANSATPAGVTELNNSGTALSPSTGFTSSALFRGGDVGVDGSGNVWVANALLSSGDDGNNVVEFVGAAVPAAIPLSTAVRTGKLGARP